MTASSPTVVAAVSASQCDGDNLTHVAEDDDGDVALCGKDISNEAWVDQDWPTTCLPCAVLDDAYYVVDPA